MADGVVTWPNKCNFDCFYYCWRMGLPQDITWLGDEAPVSAPPAKRAKTQ